MKNSENSTALESTPRALAVNQFEYTKPVNLPNKTWAAGFRFLFPRSLCIHCNIIKLLCCK